MSLVEKLGIGSKELVAFVGAGGKTTLLLELGHELSSGDKRIVLGTTTRMGVDQIPSWAEVGSPEDIGVTTTFVVESTDGPKIIGSKPEIFDRLYDTFDYVLVEADGARRRHIKAPAPHEPVIPSRATLVVVVAGMEALGRPISEVAHRPERVAKVVGLKPEDTVTTDVVTTLLTSRTGGLARIPEHARVVVALTGTGDTSEVIARISTHPRIERVVTRDILETRMPPLLRRSSK